MKQTEQNNKREELTGEQKEYLGLARMARRRREVPAPDVDEAWCRFAHQSGLDASSSSCPLFGRRHLWLSALGGAAAAVLVIFLVHVWIPWGWNQPPYVALQHDETPQRLRIGDRDTLLPFAGARFLSYYSNDTKATIIPDPVSRPGEAQQPTVAQDRLPRTHRLSTPRGMDFKLILPDSSEVWLNAESSIEFPVAFQHGERRVQLQGEAYFKVARNAQSPFVVSAGQMQVKVLGTEFNLRAYASDVSLVSLVKGAVEVTSRGREVLLKPGEAACCSEAGEMQIQSIDTFAVTQWTEGIFYFDNMPLVEILKELGRWYNLGVVFHRVEAMQMQVHFSASRNDEVDTAIQNLNRLRKVRITIEEENIVVY